MPFFRAIWFASKAVIRIRPIPPRPSGTPPPARRRDRPAYPKGIRYAPGTVETSGRLLEKEELMRRLWPDSLVEEGSLAQNVWLLRKPLGRAMVRRNLLCETLAPP